MWAHGRLPEVHNSEYALLHCSLHLDSLHKQSGLFGLVMMHCLASLECPPCMLSEAFVGLNLVGGTPQGTYSCMPAHTTRSRHCVPLARALQTACGAFGADPALGPDQTGTGIRHTLMAAQSGLPGICTAHEAIWSAPHGPPIVAQESCREHIGVAPCGRRHPTDLHRRDFPGVNSNWVSCLVLQTEAWFPFHSTRNQARSLYKDSSLIHRAHSSIAVVILQVTSAEDVLWTVRQW